MSVDFVTSKVLAEHLGVSKSALRRMVTAYVKLYGELPRVSPTSRQHLFPMLAVQRLEAAQQVIRDAPGLSVGDALKALRDGVRIPHRVQGAFDDDSLAPVMAELHILRSEVTNLRSELAGMRTLLQMLADRQGGNTPCSDVSERVLDESVAVVRTWKSAITGAAVHPRAAGLQPNLTRLLTDLETGYTLLDVRGEVVLLTPSGQQVRLVDARTVATLVRQGWLARDGQGFRVTVPPLNEPSLTAQENRKISRGGVG